MGYNLVANKESGFIKSKLFTHIKNGGKQMKRKFTIVLGFAILAAAGLFFACQGTKGEARHAELVKLYEELWNTGNFDNIAEVVTEDCEIKMSHLSDPALGHEGLKALINDQRSNFPDFQVQMLETCLKADAGGVRYTYTATGPDGKQMKSDGVSYCKVVDGRIQKVWANNNDLSWFRQLGYQLVPPQPAEEIVEVIE